MALLYIEGADGFGTGDGDALKEKAKRGNAGSPSAPTIVADGRTGPNGFRNLTVFTSDVTTPARYFIGFAFKAPLGGAGGDVTFMSAYDGGVNELLAIDDQTGAISLCNNLGTGFSVVADTWYYFELEIAPPTSTTVTLHVDGVLIDTDARSRNENISQLMFANYGLFDDLYVCDAAGAKNNNRLGDCVVETIRPSGNGNRNEWVGSDGDSVDNYALVDEQAVNDADHVKSDTVGNDDLYTYGDLAANGRPVAGVQMSSRAVYINSVRSIAHLVRDPGGTEDQGATYALTSGYKHYTDMFESDPLGSDWDESSVNAAEFGQTVVS